jgi:hypothetical protein
MVLWLTSERLGRTAVGEDREPDKVREWLEENDLLLSWRGQLTRIGALLAPILSSTAMHFLGSAGG